MPLKFKVRFKVKDGGVWVQSRAFDKVSEANAFVFENTLDIETFNIEAINVKDKGVN